jgi:hypothetical protein
MTKNIIIVAVLLGLGWLFFLQKQHERKEAIELKKREEMAFLKAHAPPSPSPFSAKPSKKPTPILEGTGTPKPKPTPMLPKPTPMLRPGPSPT